ncbi:MAG: cysteine desulfurase family protein [Nitrospinae bacterium]|nr:cysteine desulfurase family protein [Nitrospinota bacterium]
MKTIYMDHNATTPMRPEVVSAMQPYLGEKFGNPNSIHRYGRETRIAIENARDHAAALIGAADSDEIFFTSGGTESDNWALRGVISAARGRGHVVTTAIEHEAVLATCQTLEAEGVEVTYLKPDRKGRVSAEEVAAAIRPDTKIVSVMWGNNEVGTIQPVHEIGAVCRERGILFHTDAVQALGKEEIDVERAGVSLLSATGHKINASKGTGFLYVKKGTTLDPFMTGGGQEQKLRSGTENVAGIVAMGEACRIAKTESPQFAKNISAMRDRLENEICEHVPDVLVNGDTDHRLPGTSNLGFIGAEGETLLIRLDLEGIAVSTGAACSSGSPEPSHVLLAMDLPKETVQGSLRFSLGYGNSDADIDRLLEVLPEAVSKVREMAPRLKSTKT